MAGTSQSPNSNSNEPVAFDERTRRVLELRRQVRAGLYQPDPEDVARAILHEWTAVGEDLARNPPPPTGATVKAVAAHFIVKRTPREAGDPGALTA